VKDPRQLAGAPLTPSGLAGLLRLVDGGQLSGRQAKRLLDPMWRSGRRADDLARQRGLFQQRDRQVLAGAVERVLEQHPRLVRRYRAGQTKLLGFFVGQLMRATDGRADPALANRLLRERLDQRPQEDD
jgi:aspartyl-tRNA(Asn)/glutamyl-tRNA(Gln) amidotransferase subunit B